MKQPRIYITGNTAGCNQQEAIEKLRHIEMNLTLIGATNYFNTATISKELSFSEQMKVRMAEIAESDVVVFGYDWNSCVECKLELQEAYTLKKEIRLDRMSDYDDIKKNLLGE